MSTVPSLQYRTVEEWLEATGQLKEPSKRVRKPAAEPAEAKRGPPPIAQAIMPRGDVWAQRGEQTRDTRTVSAAYLIDLVARAHGFTTEHLKSRVKTAAIARARAEAMVLVWMMRRDMTTPQIARLFGRSDHTTVLHALRKAGLL